VPREIFINSEYQKLISSKFGSTVKQILDCPECNIPSLSKSKASFFTDRIKLICPKMFPIADFKKEI
jgi:hypothetical protein